MLFRICCPHVLISLFSSRHAWGVETGSGCGVALFDMFGRGRGMGDQVERQGWGHSVVGEIETPGPESHCSQDSMVMMAMKTTRSPEGKRLPGVGRCNSWRTRLHPGLVGVVVAAVAAARLQRDP